MEQRKKLEKKSKIWATLIFVAIIIGLTLFLFSGGKHEIIINIFKKDMSVDEIREALEGFGIRGYITISTLSMLQVVLTFLPAEPAQVIAGLTYGLFKGTALCLIGVIIGNTIMYILYKVYGKGLSDWFKNKTEFDFEAARMSKKLVVIVFILYFLPAIPYGLICLFAASLNFKYPRYIILTTLGALPSVIIGVGLGDMALASSWIMSLSIFLVIVILLIIMYKEKDAIFKALNNYVKKHNRNAENLTVRKGNRLVLNLVTFCTKVAFDRKIKANFKNNVGKLEHPCIVLANHGSALDFVYAGRLIRKERPNVVCARLYFYNKSLKKIMKKAGVFPKSMFSSDIENVKNCMRVISFGGALTMMPEARLSTVGKFEGIQEATYKFIKKMNVPVYYVKLEGTYFAKPKWGDKVRKGAIVNATLNSLFTKEQIANVSLEELKEGIDNALYYDEFKWIEENPDIHYKSKTLAVGLENILTKCPKCGAKYSITADGMEVKCSECGLTATLDDRYSFVGEQPFKNFSEWYEWQKQEMEKEIVSNPDFKLSHHVTLKHSSKYGEAMLRVAGAGKCTFDKNGLLYSGERDGERIEKFFPLKDVYRLLFGAGEDFEIYEGKELWYFVPDEIRSCVDYYIASELLKKHYDN